MKDCRWCGRGVVRSFGYGASDARKFWYHPHTGSVHCQEFGTSTTRRAEPTEE